MEDLKDTAIVVPTMGTRPLLLAECIDSIRMAGCTNIYLVIPDPSIVRDFVERDLVAGVISDPGRGLAAAINAGISSLPTTIRYVNWLGDDDLLTTGSIRIAREILEGDTSASLAFGACDYVDAAGQVIFHSRSGRWAPWLMYLGPQMVPQPGSLFRVDDFVSVGGLDESFKFAFDLDLLMKLRRLGTFRYVRRTLSKFRWHADSLSVGGREGSVQEASRIRLRNLPVAIRPFARVWEPLVRRAILQAGRRVSARATAM